MRRRWIVSSILVLLIASTFFRQGTAAGENTDKDDTKKNSFLTPIIPKEGQAVLVRSIINQPAAAPAVPGVLSTASSNAPVPEPVSSKLVVCRVKGFELKGVSPEECKAQGGEEFETHEVLTSSGKQAKPSRTT